MGVAQLYRMAVFDNVRRGFGLELRLQFVT